MTDRYPDKPSTASDGESFARLCVRLHLELMGEDVGYHETAHEQLSIGESKAGVEFKELKKSYTGRLHIEISERTSLAKGWWPSGIYRLRDNTKRYCCGNEQDIWIFDIDGLRKWAATATEAYSHPTIRSLILRKTDAIAFYLYRFIHTGNGEYILERRLPIEAAHASHVDNCAEDGYRCGLMKISADIAARSLVPYKVPANLPPKIKPSPEAIALARRAIAERKQFEFISGKWP